MLKSKTKKLLAISFMAIFVISTVSVASLGSPKTAPQDTQTGTTITGTPADNYPDNKRPTFCETGGAKSNTYITEYKIPTACVQPLGITYDPSGNIWFTESNSGNIGKFDPVSKKFEEFVNPQWQKGEKSMMWGVEYMQDGKLWYTDSQHNLIWKFNPDDKSYAKFVFPTTSGQEAFPQMMIKNGNNLLVNDFAGRKIVMFGTDQTGQTLQSNAIPSPGNYNFTSTMTPDSTGKIWYTVWIYQQGGALVSYDPQTGNHTQYNLPIEMQAPNGISADSSGKIWITDTASSYFFSFDPSSKQFTKFITPPPSPVSYGNASGLIKTPISRPYWNYFDDQGKLWFNEQVANNLAVFDPATNSLVEYQIPSKNPNWADCGNMAGCGVAQVLDFTVSHDKVWFTEWVENNIGVLDTTVGLPFELTGAQPITLHRGESTNVSLTVTPKDQLSAPLDIVTAQTAGLNNIIISSPESEILTDKTKTINVSISADSFAIPGTYNVLVGARYNDVTISKIIPITIQ